MNLEDQLEEARVDSNFNYETDHFQHSIAQKGELVFPVPGDDAPMFELLNETGETVKLQDILKEGPVILSFFKGDFCGYCDLELKALQRSLPQFKKYGAILLGISPHTVSVSYELKEKKNLSYSILSDSGNEIAEKYGLRFKMQKMLMDVFASFGLDDMSPVYGDTGENTNTMPIPGTFVIGMDGKIIYSFVDSDHTKRAEPSDIIACLMSLN
jgi:peroxiredoxin